MALIGEDCNGRCSRCWVRIQVLRGLYIARLEPSAKAHGLFDVRMQNQFIRNTICTSEGGLALVRTTSTFVVRLKTWRQPGAAGRISRAYGAFCIYGEQRVRSFRAHSCAAPSLRNGRTSFMLPCTTLTAMTIDRTVQLSQSRKSRLIGRK